MKNWSRRRKWAAGVGAFMLLAGIAGYAYRTPLALWGFDTLFAGHVQDKLERTYVPLARTRSGNETGEIPADPSVYSKQDPFSLLLLGTDQRDDDEPARSDTMILSVVRPNDGAILMISIPRDAYVTIPDPEDERPNDRTKITHAYAYGGADLAVATVEELFGMRVDHYASINFEGFRDVIDAMGGISLPIEKDLVNDDKDHEKFVVKAGQPSYNGTDALNYVRFREDGGDEVRTKRHHVFVNAMLDKASEPSQWSKIPRLLDIMGDNFKTDIPPEGVLELAKTMFAADTRSVYSHTLKGEGRIEDRGGAWYYYIEEDDLEDMKEMAAAWLDADTALTRLPKPGDTAAPEGPEAEAK